MTAQSSMQRSSTGGEQVAGRRIWQAGVLAIVAAVVANVLVRMLLFAVLDLPTDFPPLQIGAIALFTALGVGIGVGVFALINRRSQQPIRTFRRVAIIALVISIVPNLALMFNPASAPFPGGSALAFGVLIIFHLVAGAIAIGLLTTLTRNKA